MIDIATAQILMGQEVGWATVTAAFNAGFSDYRYAAHFTEEQMQRFVERNALRLEHSAVAVVPGQEGWRSIGLALLGLHGRQAWCGGLAVAAAARGQGVGRRLMQAIHQQAAAVGAEEMSLEVLQSNVAAQRLYAALHYRHVRNLLIWESAPDARVGMPEGYRLLRAAPAAVLEPLYSWQSLVPAWQRARHVIGRLADECLAYVMSGEEDGPALGYALCLPMPSPPAEQRMRLVAFAVVPEREQAPLRSCLLQAVLVHHPGVTFTVLNEPEESPMTPALRAAGFHPVETQYELQLGLG